MMTKSGYRGLRMVVGVWTVGALLAGCASSRSGTNASGGFATPQAAVTQLLADVSSHHYGEVIKDLAPGESAALHDPLERLIAQLDRLGVFQPGTDLDNIGGVNTAFSNPTYTVQNLSPDIALVHFTGGRVTATADASKLPLGSTVTSQIPKFPPATTHTTDLNTGSKGIATLQVNGHWYISLNYTAAENAMHPGGQTGTGLGATPIQPVGASSPDAAVGDLLTSLAADDLSHLLAITPPDELPAARQFGQAADSAAQRLNGRLHDSNLKVSVRQVTYADSRQSDGVLVVIKSISIAGSVAGTPFSYTNGCLSVEGIQFCRNNLGQFMASQHVPAAAQSLVGVLNSLRPKLGIVAVQEGGKWYVSPTRTVIDDTTNFLAAMSPQQLQTIIQDVKELQSRG